ncbi:MAG: biopolymer transporter ExbD [Lentisphaeria bacterium]|nr:biopolymer transporter ExbD [Lentisphaeria bacterium]
MGMKIARKKDEVLAVPTSSMGDIAFLLIIFFMLTSKFMQESHIEHELPTSPDVQQIEDQTVSIMVDKDGALWLQGQPSTPELMKEELDKQRGDNENFTVMFKVDKGVQAEAYEKVIRKLADAGVKVAFVGESSSSYNQ